MKNGISQYTQNWSKSRNGPSKGESLLLTSESPCSWMALRMLSMHWVSIIMGNSSKRGEGLLEDKRYGSMPGTRSGKSHSRGSIVTGESIGWNVVETPSSEELRGSSLSKGKSNKQPGMCNPTGYVTNGDAESSNFEGGEMGCVAAR